MSEHTNPPRIWAGDRVQFDGKSTSWLARAQTAEGRYVLLTGALFGKIYYTIVDYEKGIRGPMNVIGWGLGIETLSGPDPEIDDAIDRLQGTGVWTDDECWEVSRRGHVTLRITSVRSLIGGYHHDH